MNPTKTLTMKLIAEKSNNLELSILIKKEKSEYNLLKSKHSSLIDSSCEIENKLNDVLEGVNDFCEGCSEKYGGVCSECCLRQWLK